MDEDVGLGHKNAKRKAGAGLFLSIRRSTFIFTPFIFPWMLAKTEHAARRPMQMLTG
jgi:hypothetical protein